MKLRLREAGRGSTDTAGGTRARAENVEPDSKTRSPPARALPRQNSRRRVQTLCLIASAAKP